MRGKDVSVVLKAMTTQAIDFTKNLTSLRGSIRVPGMAAIDINHPLVQGVIAGNSSDTILVASGVNLASGITDIIAYLGATVGIPSNDTSRLSLEVRPSISVRIPSKSDIGSNNCLTKDMLEDQEVWVRNTGNMPISNVSITLEVDDANPLNIQTYFKTLSGTILPGDSNHVVIQYIVPDDYYYNVTATAKMLCDTVLVNDKKSIQECVIMEDLVLRVINPQYGETDIAGTRKGIEVSVENKSRNIDYQNVNVWARVEDEQGTASETFSDIIYDIYASTTVSLNFDNSTYLVPKLLKYYLRVFIETNDIYPKNDTVLLELYTPNSIEDIVSEGFTVGQNIPNPAKNSTKIAYNIPASGEVIFNVQTVSGQVLHTEVRQSDAGKQFIEFNTTGFAAGIYFYSIEYQGQKIVKRMSVKN
jgi:hypothetical protein